jgi:hypothetical protein
MDLKPSQIKELMKNQDISKYTSTMGLIKCYLYNTNQNDELSREEMYFLHKNELIDMFFSKKIKLNLKDMSEQQLKDLDVQVIDGSEIDFNELKVSQLVNLAKNKIDIKGLKAKSDIVEAVKRYFK